MAARPSMRTFSPDSAAMALARWASWSGTSAPPGSFTRSRDVRTARAMATPRATAALTGRAVPAVNVTERTFDSVGVARWASKR